MAKSEAIIERLTYSVVDAVAATGIGKDKFYEAFKKGELTPKQYGTRTLIPADRLKAWLASLPDLAKPRPDRAAGHSRAKKAEKVAA